MKRWPRSRRTHGVGSAHSGAPGARAGRRLCQAPQGQRLRRAALRTACEFEMFEKVAWILPRIPLPWPALALLTGVRRAVLRTACEFEMFAMVASFLPRIPRQSVAEVGTKAAHHAIGDLTAHAAGRRPFACGKPAAFEIRAATPGCKQMFEMFEMVASGRGLGRGFGKRKGFEKFPDFWAPCLKRFQTPNVSNIGG